jgi:type IV pilus assembly protein PilW
MHKIRFHQLGLSLVSLMVSLTIGMFLLLGLFGIWYQTHQTFSAQDQLAHLQDNERMALTIMANIVQTAGYYPNYLNYSGSPPSTPYTQTTVFLPTAPFVAAGQFVAGTYSATAPGDTLTLRFMADASTLDCLGQTDVTATVVTNQFTVDNNGNLQCAVNGGAPQTIVTGVSNISILYGVDTVGDGSAHEYMNASTVTANTDWSSVRSVAIQLTFNNPLSGQPGQPTLPAITRTIAVTQGFV